MKRTVVRLVTCVAVLAPLGWAQYTASSLGAPVDLPTYTTITAYALNNLGQVYGRAVLPGFSGGPRVPVLWTNGVGHSLPIPPGFTWSDGGAGGNLALNDAGVVAATVTDNSTGALHIIVWNNGVPSILPRAPQCSGVGANGQILFGMNRAGHIVGFAESGNGNTCLAYWLYDGASFHTISSPPPNFLCNGTAFIVNLPGKVVNDADHVAMEDELAGCSPQPVIFSPPSNIDFLPPVAGSGTTLNNRDQMMIFFNGVSGPDDVFWDGSVLHDLHGAPAFLNSMGQVAYMQAGSILLWNNGAPAAVTLPNGVTGSLEGFNDAGQLLVGNFVLSPSGPCGQDITSQVLVTRGGFRLNHTTGHFTQTLSVTNLGPGPVTGPISVVFDNLPVSASLFGTSGATLCEVPNGSPFQNISAAPLAAGTSVSGTIEFIDTAQTGITYNVRVLAGPGGR